ncbi:MAG: hypothetical protein EXS14_10555 [Planctomycetes bacterium]|nr:hypothetical protein [Planctomycetota bacterium]
MQHWIDGYNLLCHLKLDQGCSLEQARSRVVGLVSGANVRLYFDAKCAGGSERRAGVDVIYSAGASADDRIVSDLRTTDGKNITVVTNDRELTNRCRQLGAQVCSCGEYMQARGKPRRTKTGATSDPARPSGVRTKTEMDEWMRLFGEEKKRPN